MNIDDLRSAMKIGRLIGDSDAEEAQERIAELECEVERLRAAYKTWSESTLVVGSHQLPPILFSHREVSDGPRNAVIDEMIALFEEYREHFGLDGEQSLDMACEFEDKFNVLICKVRGHEIGPDQCGKPEHDYCYRCHQLRVDLETQNARSESD